MLLFCFKQYIHWRKEFSAHLNRTTAISMTRFDIVFSNLSDEDSLSFFRFRKKEIKKIAAILVEDKWSTVRNQYSTTPLLSLCVVLRRMATPFRWRDVERFFGKHSSHVSEIFWETVESILERYGHLVSGALQEPYILNNASRYALAVQGRTGALNNCIGFIDGTNLKIARPKGNGLQNVVYNGHKRTHTLKYQAVTTPDGMFLHVFGPMEGRRHDWTLYSRSGIDGCLEQTMCVDGFQYCLYGDSGYNNREYLCIPFQGHVNEDQRKFNQVMSGARVTVEWMFKELKLSWTTMDFKRKLKVKEAPVGSCYVLATLLCNIQSCFYGNQVATYFNCAPPTLEEFLSCRSPATNQ